MNINNRNEWMEFKTLKNDHKYFSINKRTLPTIKRNGTT